MASGSGIAGAVMFGAETTWNTPVTVDHSIKVLTETFNLDKTFLQDEGIHGGGYMPLVAGNVETQRSVAGGITMNLPTKGIDLLLKQMLGSNPTKTLLVTPAYKSIHQVGTTDGYSGTWQVQRPQRNGTIKPFTYQGVKIIGWELTITAGSLVTLSLTFDGADGITATAAATYSLTSGTKAWAFGQGTVLKLGGTASTTSGLVSVASGVQVASIVKEMKITQTRGTSNQDYGVGFGGVKAEQLNNAWGDIKIAMTTEFSSQAEIYDPYIAGTVMPVQLTLLGSAIGASGSVDTFDVIASAAKITDMTGPNISGPDLLQQSLTFTCLDDQANSPFQVVTINSDVTL